MEKNIGIEFMKKTQYQYLEDSDQEKGLPQPPLERAYDETKTLIDLPKPENFQIPDKPLREIIEKRTSLRKYADQCLSMEELSYLLWCTQGVKEIVSRPATLRTVPSAGARHPFETYLLVNHVEGIPAGLYRFIATKHQLQEVSLNPHLADQMVEACLKQAQVKTSGVTFIWAADAYRTTWRYGERGYRYMLLDAGHVCQNLYLAAESIDCGVCAIAAYEDEMVNHLLDMDGENQFVIYIGTVGKRIRE